MAYLDTYAAKRPNIAVTAAVVAIEAALAVAVMRGLAVTVLPHKEPDRLYADNVPVPHPTPTEKPPEHKADKQPAVTPPYSSPVVGPLKPVEPILIDLPTPAPSPVATFQPPKPIPTPVALGRPAMPRGDPANWVSTSDYPSRDLREGNQGRVGFALALGLDGRVTSCRVTAPSGHPGLDEATCNLVAHRARFTPALGSDGRPSAGSYSGTIRWVIPD